MIGTASLPLNFGLAPMEGVTDLPFRLWLSLASDPAWTSTPFLRVTSTFPMRRIPESFCPELHLLKNSVRYQLIPQLMAAEADDFIRLAHPLLKDAAFVDLNCGCPAPNSVGSGAGSRLLASASRFDSFLRQCSDQLGAEKFSIKMRCGFTTAEEFEELLPNLRQIPLKQLQLHGRTRSERYSGYARWELVAKAEAVLPYPVIGSGDILSWPCVEARAGFLRPKQGLIIGRGALRNPWIFLELRERRLVTISARTLYDSLLSYALLVELYRHDYTKLLEFVRQGFCLSPCLTDEERWQECVGRLTSLRFGEGQKLDLGLLDRTVLGRVKLVWNYLRSSLPEHFFSPQQLRRGNLEAFFAGLTELSLPYQNQAITLRHKPQLDWIYTSDKKSPGPYSESGLREQASSAKDELTLETFHG